METIELLVPIVMILALCMSLSASLKKISPPVVAFMLAGVLCSQAVMGRFLPQIQEDLFKAEFMTAIAVVSLLAISTFGSRAGMHFEPEELSGKGIRFIVLSVSCFVIPLAMSYVILQEIFLSYPYMVPQGVSHALAALGLAIALSATAVPILTATLESLGMIHSQVGQLALGCASVGELMLWPGVSMVIALSRGDTAKGAVVMIILAIAYTLIVIAMRPGLSRLIKREIWTRRTENECLVIIFLYCLLSGMITELIGIHYLYGMFIGPAFLPKAIKGILGEHTDKMVMNLLLPFFFMSAGLRMNVDLGDTRVWMACLIVTALAFIGKFAGTYFTSRRLFFPHSPRDAAIFSCSMQSRGVIEISVIMALLDAGNINQLLFSAMFLMTIITTSSAMPLTLLADRRYPERSLLEMAIDTVKEAEHAALEELGHAAHGISDTIAIIGDASLNDFEAMNHSHVHIVEEN